MPGPRSSTAPAVVESDMNVVVIGPFGMRPRGTMSVRAPALRPDMVHLFKCQASDWFLDSASLNVLAQTTLDSGKIVVDSHAGASSLCMNCRTGSEVR